MTILNKRIDAGNGLMIPIKIDSTWDEDTLDMAVEEAIRTHQESMNSKREEARAVTEEQRGIRDEIAQNTKAWKQYEMSHPTNDYVKPENNYSASYERARGVPDSEAFRTLMGAEFSALGQGARMGFNKLTGDTEEYDRLKQEYESQKAAIKPLEETHPWVNLAARSTPYMAASPTVATAPFRMAAKTIPQSLRVTPIAYTNAMAHLNSPVTGIGRFLNGQGPMSSIVNPIKVANASLSRATNFAPEGSKTAAVLNTLDRPAVQAAVGGGTIGALHPDDSALQGAGVAMATSGLARLLLGPVSKAPVYLTGAQKEARKAAKDIGYYLDPGTKTGDPFKEQITQVLRRDPIASPIAANIDNNNSRVVNLAIGKHFGIVDETPELNADTLWNIRSVLGQRLGKFYDMSKPVFTKRMIDKLDKIAANESKLWEGGGNNGNIIRAINNIKHAMDISPKKRWGKMTPEQIQQWETELRTIEQGEMLNKQGNPRRGKVFNQIRAVLDSALEEGLPKDVRKKVMFELKKAKKNFREFSIIQQSTDKNSGKIDLAKLYDNFVGTPTARQTAYKFLKEDSLISKLARIGRLERETKAKMDLGTRSIVGSVLHEKRPVYNKLMKGAITGLYGLPSNFIKKGVANMYFNPSGYPAATGALPIFSKEAGERFNKMITRGAFGEIPNDEENINLSLWE